VLFKKLNVVTIYVMSNKIPTFRRTWRHFNSQDSKLPISWPVWYDALPIIIWPVRYDDCRLSLTCLIRRVPIIIGLFDTTSADYHWSFWYDECRLSFIGECLLSWIFLIRRLSIIIYLFDTTSADYHWSFWYDECRLSFIFWYEECRLPFIFWYDGCRLSLILLIRWVQIIIDPFDTTGADYQVRRYCRVKGWIQKHIININQDNTKYSNTNVHNTHSTLST
jgi:hypothetical protein